MKMREQMMAALGADARARAPAEPIPEHLRALPPDRVVDLDVREDIRRGHEPFAAISQAASALPEGHVLRVRAPFEPAPLYAVLGRRGLVHHAERLGEEDWRVWFVHGEGGAATAAPPSARGAVAVEDGLVTIDVRGLEPPEPMVRTISALDSLPRGATLVQINERIPQFLLPKLQDLGFEYEAHRADDGTVRLHIRHRQKEKP